MFCNVDNVMKIILCELPLPKTCDTIKSTFFKEREIEFIGKVILTSTV